MRLLTNLRRLQEGSVLLPTLVFSGIMGIGVLSMMELSAYRTRLEYHRWTSNEAYYHAENAMNWALQLVADATTGGTDAPFLGQYSVSDGSLGLPYMTSMRSQADSDFKDAWVTIANHGSGVTNLYLITSSAQVGNRARTLQATVKKWPPSQVFDYEYFLNNWGWWWGSTITGNGDNRANWDFDFRYNPVVNGSLFASGRVASSGVPVDPFGPSPPIRGTAVADLLANVHAGVPRVAMPNLLDFTYYKGKATSYDNGDGTIGSRLYLGSTLVVDAVHDTASQPGLYLKGTATNPIKIQGPVVVDGDVVISGPVTGVGTLYVGGNLYIAGNLTYQNGPSFATPPSTQPQAACDTWVGNARAAKKDLIAFAVRQSVLGGDVNSSDWKSMEYDAATYGLAGLGNEASLGQDGIRGTPDDGISYAHYVGSNLVNNASYDADGDGVIRGNYNYANDLQMTAARAAKIANYPTIVDPSNPSRRIPAAYSTLASNNYNRLDGIFYCNHAVANRMAGSGVVWNGAVICRDEAIVFYDTLRFVYDPRVHSRYSTDPNSFVDLGLPVANTIRVDRMDEIVPIAGFYSGSY